MSLSYRHFFVGLMVAVCVIGILVAWKYFQPDLDRDITFEIRGEFEQQVEVVFQQQGTTEKRIVRLPVTLTLNTPELGYTIAPVSPKDAHPIRVTVRLGQQQTTTCSGPAITGRISIQGSGKRSKRVSSMKVISLDEIEKE